MKVLITGTSGLLGGYLVREGERRGDAVTSWRGSADGDLRDADAVKRFVERVDPDVVIHAAAMAFAGDCSRDPDKARAVNARGTANIVAAGARRLVHVSTDLVFDGEGAPYREDSPTSPTSVYGRTKVEAEQEAAQCSNSVIARVSLLYGPSLTKRVGFFDTQLETLRKGTPLALFDDEWRTPLSLRAAAAGLFAIAESSFTGILHVAGPERMNRWEMGMRIAKWLEIEQPAIEKKSRLSIAGEPRPRDVSLDTSLFREKFPGIATSSLEDELAWSLRDHEI
jgi:dTDP-4-dehydrorhamnose reductase